MPLTGAEKILPKVLWLLQKEKFYLNNQDRRVITRALTDLLSGTTSSIPENILQMMQEKSAYLSEENRKKLYQKVIDILVEKKGLSFDKDVQEKLQDALDFMVLRKEKNNLTRFLDSDIYTQVNGEKLLLRALRESYWILIPLIIKNGKLSNIPSVSLEIQKREGIGKYVFTDVDYENARAAVIAYLSNSQFSEHNDETEKKALQDALALIITQGSANQFEVVKPIFSVPSNMKALNIDELLSTAIRAGHGAAVMFMIERGPRNIARSLLSLGEQTTVSWTINRIVSTWKTGSHEETYQALVNKLLTLDAEYFNENSKNETEALVRILNDLIAKSEHWQIRKILGVPCILEHLDSGSLFPILEYLLNQLEKFGSEKEAEGETENIVILRNICKKIVLKPDEIQKLVNRIIEKDILIQTNSIFEKRSDSIEYCDLGLSVIFSESNMIKQIKNKLISAIRTPSVSLMHILLQGKIDAFIDVRDCSILISFAITGFDLGNFELAKICVDKIMAKQQEDKTSNMPLPTPLLDALLVITFHIKENNPRNPKKNELQRVQSYLIEKLNDFEAEAFGEAPSNATLLSNLNAAAKNEEYGILIALLELIASKRITIEEGAYDAVLSVIIQNPDPSPDPLEQVKTKTRIVNVILNDTHNSNNLSLRYVPSVNDWEDLPDSEDRLESKSTSLLALCKQKRYFGIAIAISEYATKHHKIINDSDALGVGSRDLSAEMHFALERRPSSSEFPKLEPSDPSVINMRRN